MATTPHRYITQCLSASGLCIVDTRWAWELRPDLWASPQMPMQELAEPQPPLPGVHRLLVEIDGRRLLVLARSMSELQNRLHWISGATIGAITVAPPREKTAEPANPMAYDRARREAARRERVRQLAAMPLPAHGCQLRKDILAARVELEGGARAAL